MKYYILFYNTIKYLKWSQIYFRVLRKLVKPKVTDRFDRVLPERNSRFVNFWLYDENQSKYASHIFKPQSGLNFQKIGMTILIINYGYIIYIILTI